MAALDTSVPVIKSCDHRNGRRVDDGHRGEVARGRSPGVAAESEIISAESGTVNGTAYTWTLIEGAWTATVERAADDTYAVALAAVTAAGVSTNYALTLYYGLLSLITDRTRADVENETDKGFYNASDLNRVGAAVEYIAGRFAALGYDCPVTVKKDWLTSGAPTASQLETYRQNIVTLRGRSRSWRPRQSPGEHGGAGLRQGKQYRADFARPRRAHRQHHKIMVLLRRAVRRRGMKGDNMQDKYLCTPGAREAGAGRGTGQPLRPHARRPATQGHAAQQGEFAQRRDCGFDGA